jgi:hypothetical protein
MVIWEAQRAANVQLSTFAPGTTFGCRLDHVLVCLSMDSSSRNPEYGPVGSGYSQFSHPEAVDALIEDEAVRQRRRFKVLHRAADLQAEVVRPTGSKPVTYNELPLIDVGPLYDPDATRAQVNNASQAVHDACIAHGFLYIHSASVLIDWYHAFVAHTAVGFCACVFACVLG